MFKQNIPKKDSDNSVLLDIFGMGRTITVNGVIIGTYTEQNTFIEDIEGLMNGDQSGAFFYSSLNTTSTKFVFVDGFEWSVSEGITNKLVYTLILVEGRNIDTLPEPS